jgi:hypothetical protein
VEGVDLGIFSAEKLRTAAVDAAAVEMVAEVVEAEEEVAVVALKHFWHILLVAGLPVTPQLLAQRDKASGTLNSVSSFSVL